MQLFQELDKAIKRKNNGAIDALMFISKIEQIKNNKFNHQEFKNKISTFYKEPSKQHYQIYESDPSLFYRMEELSANEKELFVEKIENHLSKINLKVENIFYKIAYFRTVNKYLKQIGIDSKVFKKIMLFQYLRLFMLGLIIVAASFIVNHTINTAANSDLVKTPYEIINYIFTYSLFKSVMTLLIAWGFFLIFPRRSLLAAYTLFITLLIVGASSSVVFYYNDEPKIMIAQIDEVRILEKNNNIKKVTFDLNGKTHTYYTHKNLNLIKNGEYRLKYNEKLGVIVGAELLVNDLDLKTVSKTD